MISIVLPTFNRTHMLPACLDNILAQTYQNYEVIVVNDCSTDTTKDVLDRYKDHPKIRIIHNETNLKTPGALNAGFRSSKGDYLTWTSDDNFVDPKFCEMFMHAFKKKPYIDYMYCNYYSFTDVPK